jgi:dTDP-4-dehydrorhamnose reductase
MRVLVTGGDGQLGRALAATAPAEVTLSAPGIAQLDVTDEAAVRRACAEFDPGVVVNAAAYTAVDLAEEESEAAWTVNRDGARHLARVTAERGTRLIQVSTDFVFDGNQGTPYRPDDPTSPLSVYGASKLAGELAVRELAGPGWLILRTAWLYEAGGHNFVNTMLGLMRRGIDLRIVADQTGTPTWATGLARAIWRAIEEDVAGIHHWTDAGIASWYDLAVAVQEEAHALGLVDVPVDIVPIRTEDYPVAAPRPAYSVLDKTSTWKALGIVPGHWRKQLRTMLSSLADQPAKTHHQQAAP